MAGLWWRDLSPTRYRGGRSWRPTASGRFHHSGPEVLRRLEHSHWEREGEWWRIINCAVLIILKSRFKCSVAYMKHALPEVLSHDAVQFLSHSAVNGALRSLLWCFEEYWEQCEHQRHQRGVTHQIGLHRPRVDRVYRHVRPWGLRASAEEVPQFHCVMLWRVRSHVPVSLRASSLVNSTLASLLWQ